ncbi:DeoR family transcriptional regulator [Rubrobacter tropicus]|uniref:DeoR family transcriptional regulator n=1 Tax=Rubrobacter tropicus TaxID=2653851 RepID=A0A6G8Q4Z2_9ACTN|nr:DeoR/GlpR family DNA-binding transcription regulator [Rubrobacter tropicus]QIN81508.1 DeoR family transcriptional regulator [Rubrobacter tropicus]
MSDKRADLPGQRQQRIAELVRESGSVTVSRLEEDLGISSATARRDLAVLERQGKVKRTHGGAVMPGFTQHEDSFQQRLGEAVEAKGRLARVAAAMLEADETVFVDSSTTAYYAARRILADAPSVTCLTNLVPVMDLFSTADPSGASMVGVGGIFRALTLSFVGPCAVRTVESYLADRAFVSVKGITAGGHLTDADPLEAEVKRAMIRQSDKPVLLVDGRKFERRGMSVIGHVSEVSLVLTADAHPSHVRALEDLGVAVKSV